jgi:hypothetical protein
MIAAALLLAAASPDTIAGTWAGTSLCQVKASPCRDEHVIYRFTPKQPRSYRIDAYKLVAGRQMFMGSIDVLVDPARNQMDGPVMSGGQSVAKLHLTLKGAHLSGNMTLADGTLYRLIEADRH